MVFAEHALAGAGHVGGDDVEEAAQRGEGLGPGLGDDDGGVAPFLEVLAEYLCALPDGLVGHEQTVVGEHCAPQGRFAAGGGT